MEIARAGADEMEGDDASIDDRLALEARSDIAAFALLYQQHVERVFRYLRARGLLEDDAAEVTSQTFERALSHIDSYRPGGSGLAPWLIRIARNASIDAARRRRDRPLDDADARSLLDPAPTPEDAAVTADESRWIRSLVATLPELQRDALALRFGGGLSSREIATVIGKSEAATKKLLTRSLATLKEASRHER
jgi:RNA polymerase sigma-70 factor (ECF subfamily)